uniref:Phospholipid scramblase n=1 Tax=Lepisosteus oculatus TaxID=7918 RepID=W5MXD3_LEPOC
MTSKSKRTLTLPTYVAHQTLEASSAHSEKRTSSKQTVEWVPAPAAGHGEPCSSGLEYLSEVDQVLLHPQRVLLEAFDGLPCTQKFQVKTARGQMMYCAVQRTDHQSQSFRGHRRAFQMEIYDRGARESIRLRQPFVCSLCFPWGAQEMEVQAPPGVVVGFVRELLHPWGPRYVIKDSRGEPALRIRGPGYITCCSPPDFTVFDPSWKTRLGAITGQYFGSIQGDFGDVVAVKFPRDLDEKLKALLLGASFLIESKLPCLSLCN